MYHLQTMGCLPHGEKCDIENVLRTDGKKHACETVESTTINPNQPLDDVDQKSNNSESIESYFRQYSTEEFHEQNNNDVSEAPSFTSVSDKEYFRKPPPIENMDMAYRVFRKRMKSQASLEENKSKPKCENEQRENQCQTGHPYKDSNQSLYNLPGERQSKFENEQREKQCQNYCPYKDFNQCITCLPATKFYFTPIRGQGNSLHGWSKNEKS